MHKMKQELLSWCQCLLASTLGSDDCPHAGTLAKDPVNKTKIDRPQETSEELASWPTPSHFESRVTAKDLHRLTGQLLDLYPKTHPEARRLWFRTRFP
ncbi:MAG: hypothetical protein ACUVXF_06715 [Desulfobaccales bacterium]